MYIALIVATQLPSDFNGINERERIKILWKLKHHSLHFKGAGLYVDNIYIMNIGLPERQDEILRYGMGFVLTPKNINIVTTIANLGQRQANIA